MKFLNIIKESDDRVEEASISTDPNEGDDGWKSKASSLSMPEINASIHLENSCFDDVILIHISPLARLTNARLTLVHVADGFMARNQKDLRESDEMRDDYQYLKRRELEFHKEGFDVRTVLLFGEPSKEILALAEKENFDLIAMATHGHRGLSDIILGSVASDLRHSTRIPVLQIKA